MTFPCLYSCFVLYMFSRPSSRQKENMSVFAESVPPAPLRDRSIEARRAARQAKARRERRIVDLLNRGVSVAEIAAREEVTEKRMRSVVSEILARRMPEPPAEFLALQVSRLSEALLVAYSAMSGANLRAVDRVVKIVRELDRYHGFSASRSRVLGDAPQIEHEDRLALAARASRPETAPQVLEKAQILPGNGVAPDPQDAAPAQVSPALDPAPTNRPERRRKRLKRLNPRPEMAGLRKPRTRRMPRCAAKPSRPASNRRRKSLWRSTRRRPIARKRRRKRLKKLNLRPEMARARYGSPRSAAHLSSARPSSARAPSDG